MHALPEDCSLLTVGFKKLKGTVLDLALDYPAVLTMIGAVAFAEAGANAFVTIAVTYTTEVLKMTSSETGILIALCLVFAVPGSVIFKHVTHKIGPHKSYMASLAWWGVVTAVAPLFMAGPDQKNNAYIFGVFWGFGFGWLYPTQRVVYCLVIPGGQESELMGVYIFAGQILVWLPPAVFTVMNEKNINMAWGLMSDASFFFAALAIVWFMDFEGACEKAKATEGKRVCGVEATNDKLGDKGRAYSDVGDNHL